ncbi:hypothetical protein, partial [uncultured Flavonifractor sp.]|uniref:hypothetical protein n=1 Tax=uncultured Flavonifractor sp. TaxID=1193534 RepID=UPI00262479E3
EWVHHSGGGDAPSSAVKLHFLSGVRIGCLSSIKHHDPLPYVGSTWNGIPEPYLQIKIKFL